MRFAKRNTIVTTLAVVAGLAGALVAPAQAQTAPAKTRQEARAEMADFMKTHRWDDNLGQWVPDEAAAKAPGATQPREAVRAQLNQFLRSHRWNESTGEWQPLKPERQLSTLNREQVRAETVAFLKSHRWDENSETWVDNPPPRAKKK